MTTVVCWAMRSTTRTRMTGAALGIACAILASCVTAATDLPPSITGIYSLAQVSGRGPAVGTLVLTRHGYAERRVRFMESDSTLSMEHLARGTAELGPDGSIVLTLRELDPYSDIPWTPKAQLIAGGVQITYDDLTDGSAIVETWRRQ